jgi:uncharacterized protein YjbJ (UPF0337 family)
MIRNAEVLEGQWKQLRGKVKQRWAALTDDDLLTIEGSFDVLVALLQEKYGYARWRAEEEVEQFLSEVVKVKK